MWGIKELLIVDKWNLYTTIIISKIFRSWVYKYYYKNELRKYNTLLTVMSKLEKIIENKC